MNSEVLTPQEYISKLSDDRKPVISELRDIILRNLPEGFSEVINYNMIGYVVPHSLYPKGYHGDPKQPLPFINIASRKNFIALYHMGLYINQDLLKWFENEYPKYSKNKLDMGKSCIRFKKIEQLPYQLIAQLVQKMTPQEWIEIYEVAHRSRI